MKKFEFSTFKHKVVVSKLEIIIGDKKYKNLTEYIKKSPVYLKRQGYNWFDS